MPRRSPLFVMSSLLLHGSVPWLVTHPRKGYSPAPNLGQKVIPAWPVAKGDVLASGARAKFPVFWLHSSQRVPPESQAGLRRRTHGSGPTALVGQSPLAPSVGFFASTRRNSLVAEARGRTYDFDRVESGAATEGATG